MSAIDPAEARLHVDDPPGVTLPPTGVLLSALLAGALLWAAAAAVAMSLLG